MYEVGGGSYSRRRALYGFTYDDAVYYELVRYLTNTMRCVINRYLHFFLSSLSHLLDL